MGKDNLVYYRGSIQNDALMGKKPFVAFQKHRDLNGVILQKGLVDTWNKTVLGDCISVNIVEGRCFADSKAIYTGLCSDVQELLFTANYFTPLLGHRPCFDISSMQVDLTSLDHEGKDKIINFLSGGDHSNV